MDDEEHPRSSRRDSTSEDRTSRDGASLPDEFYERSRTEGGGYPSDDDPAPVLRSVFFGSDGLRPGWGLLLFFVLFTGLRQLTSMLLEAPQYPAQSSTVERRVQASRLQTPGGFLVGEGLGFALVSLTTWIMAQVERRPVTRYGFGGRRRMAKFFSGFAAGMVFLSMLVGALWKSGLLVFEGRLLSGAAIFENGAIWLLGFLLVAMLEEYLLRGYPQFTLSRGAASLCEMLFGIEDGRTWGFWIAAVVLSFLFGFGHSGNPGESPLGLVSAGLIGLVFCLSLWRTGSLWWALGFHAAWDWAQSFVFGVADSGLLVDGRLLGMHPAGNALLSGGTTGPEGSILVLPLLAMVAGVVMLIPKERRADIYEIDER